VDNPHVEFYIHNHVFNRARDLMANGQGGKRAGAGRPRGVAWKSPTRGLRAEARAKLAEIVGSDLDPLTFVCQLATDADQDPGLRLSAAAIALPYLHPRLSAIASVTARLPDGGDPREVVATVLERLERMRSPAVIDGSATELRTQDGHVSVEVANNG
jgi:hypothetical protein